MKNNKKKIIIIGSTILAILIGIFLFLFFSDENKLTKTEKNWMSDNLKNIQNLYVINDINVFGDNGTGVYYDFIRDFQTEYRFEINPITFNQNENFENNAFIATNTLEKNDTVFYEDHYVLISKNNIVVSGANDFSGKNVGLLNRDKEYVGTYIKNYTFTGYESKDELYKALDNGNVEYVMVPIIRDLDLILSKDYKINYHYGDIKYYFCFRGAKNDKFASIIRKYFNNWKDEYLDEIFNSNELITFKNALNLTDADITKIQGVTYNYGFINHNPYEVITGGNFGGIVAVYLKEFSDFANVEFKFHKYSNFEKFEKAMSDGKIDIYYNYYDYANKFNEISSNKSVEIEFIAPLSSDVSISTLESLNNKTVYVQKRSKIARYLKNNTSINLKYYDNQKDLFKIAKDDNIIAIDKEVFSYYHKNKLEKYESRYSLSINETYNFKTKDKQLFNRLLDKYISTLDTKAITYNGLFNHYQTVLKGNILSSIAKYLMIAAAICVIVFTTFYKKSKKIMVTKKIKNDEKMKYIDILTSLKNRNYLTENMDVWNNNTIYPQTMIVIDLNSIQYLNDTKGYEAGDKQITALANILIKSQLDNSDIMRTNGNEFLIYLVGYQQKHIVNYIHKLSKELKKLPYEYGAAIGYSMITDDIKTIEDAINEAIEDMKKQKPSHKDDRK